MIVIADESRKARKPHRCVWCGQTIEVGSVYRYQRVVFEGDPQSNCWHPECLDAMHDDSPCGGEDYWFDMWQQPRPVAADSATGAKE